MRMLKPAPGQRDPDDERQAYIPHCESRGRERDEALAFVLAEIT